MAKNHSEDSVQLGTQPVADRRATIASVPDKGASYHNGKLTRLGMERAIQGGGSVIYGGNVISTLDKLPDDAELASSPDEVQAALDAVDAQIAALQARKGKLNDAKK